ncbi:hypothetical protein A2U01_0074446, partial [Trifolium medium]|nr:hypothetical protein [Trifolium medium]
MTVVLGGTKLGKRGGQGKNGVVEFLDGGWFGWRRWIAGYHSSVMRAPIVM